MNSIKILALVGVIFGITGPMLAEERSIMEKTLPAYTIALSAETLNSSTCRDELLLFREAVDQRILWALKVLDSSGGLKSGFIYGNNYWMGVKSQCYDSLSAKPLTLANYILQNNSRFRKPEEETSPIDLKYFVAHAKHNSTLQYHIRFGDEDTVSLGLCLPASCSTSDISGILKRIFHNRTLLIGELYSADLKLVEVRDLQDDHRWLLNGKIIFFATLVMILILLMIAGTVYDITVYQKHLKLSQKTLVYENNNTTPEVKCNTNDSEEAAVKLKPRSFTLGEEMLMCFSIYTNTNKLLDTKLGKNSVPCIHGMKFIGMVWIIIAHAVYFTVEYTDNRTWVWKVESEFLSSLLTNATSVVDSYLFFSGFLVTYLYWCEIRGKEDSKKAINWAANVQNICLMLIKRYLRLTPTYMLLLGFHQINAQWYSKTSIFNLANGQHELCDKYWWRNMFYINNFFDVNSMCMIWSWYLAVDMQLYTLAAILLTLSCIFLYTTAFILGFLLIGSIILSGYISYSLKFILTLDEEHRSFTTLYAAPWVRLSPYALGCILAFILVKCGTDIRLNKKTLYGGWCLAVLCNTATMSGLWNTPTTVLSTAFYVALSRTAWSLGIAWVIFICYTNNAGAINSFLSFKGFIPLSRLTFCAYLLNPFIIQSIYLSAEVSGHMDVLTLGTMSFGLLLTSFLCSYILCLMIEMPSTLLMNVLTKPRRQRK